MRLGDCDPGYPCSLARGQRSSFIAAFCDKIAELSPRLITSNGNRFDLLLLRYRAMVHGVSAPGLTARPYFHRYTDDAIDLRDVVVQPAGEGHSARDQQSYGPVP
jgi:hypothetical protein